jgi:type II secretory pathway component PulC
VTPPDAVRPRVPPPAAAQPPEPRDTTPRVVGVIVSEGGQALAIVEDPRTNRSRVYRVGDSIDGRRIMRILPDRVVVAGAGGDVELRLAGVRGPVPGGGPGTVAGRGGRTAASPSTEAAPGEGAAALRPTVLDRQTLLRLGSGPALETQVTSLGADGVRVVQVAPGGLLARLSLRPGDVITGVNGEEIGQDVSLPDALARAVQSGATQVRVDVRRGDADEVRDISVQP